MTIDDSEIERAVDQIESRIKSEIAHASLRAADGCEEGNGILAGLQDAWRIVRDVRAKAGLGRGQGAAVTSEFARGWKGRSEEMAGWAETAFTSTSTSQGVWHSGFHAALDQAASHARALADQPKEG